MATETPCDYRTADQKIFSIQYLQIGLISSVDLKNTH